MAESIGILIFNKDEQERRALSILMKTEDNRVYDTSDALEALHLLQKQNIGVILVGKELTGLDRKEFKGLVEKIKPGVSVTFTSPFTQKDKEFSVDIEEFLKFINDSLKNENMLYRELSEAKKFAYAIADRLLQIFAVNDRYFFNNDHMVSELSGKIAQRMGLEENTVEAIQMASLLRDLGRVVIHQQILEETKRLDQTELTPIKAHPIHTMQILRHVRFPWNLDSIISQHHEHYDGSGYPMGLKGREISIGARIINVADAYYAMITDRPYRRALEKDKAIAEIRKSAGSQFDPEVVEVFLSIISQEASDTTLKKRILIFERELNVAAMIKLGTASDDIEVIHATSSIEAISRIRQKNPQVVIADTDALETETFMRFYQTARQTVAADRHFLLIVPDKEYLERFDGEVDYVVKPVHMEQITAKIRGLLSDMAEPTQREEMRGLNGNIEDFSLTDIIQILSLGLKTAKVEITHDAEKGMLYLLRGKIIHASAGNLRGPEAFFELVKWERGNFFILHGQTTNDVNVTLDTMHLLMEACTILDNNQMNKGPQLKKYSKIY
jgi:HD-GYP domain-containing protein (c-di-GMP phosphodiesterase class II)